MNIDDLKGAWGKDEPAGMHLPNSTADLGKTASVVAKIRRKMRSEFIATLIAYVLLIAFVIFVCVTFKGTPQAVFFLNTISILLFTTLLLNGYFFSRFYLFYKTISRYDLGIKDSIRKIAYELELNIEIYKTYSICVVPLSVLITVTLIGGKGIYDYLQRMLASSVLTSGTMLWLFSTILISFAATWFFVNLHVKLQYGKYLGQLKQIGDDLGSEG
ncbi:MAG TPA: hypothetical protein VFE53_13765 [Mucilaginibacter sp.]|jgi:hypothetical protein|nr:hypothetical protein [Mucilaginibacter sp.]